MAAVVVAERKSVRCLVPKLAGLARVGLRDGLNAQRREFLLCFLYIDLNVRSQICPETEDNVGTNVDRSLRDAG